MIDFDRFEDGLRGLALGVFLVFAIVALSLCAIVGAWTIAVWIWSLA